MNLTELSEVVSAATDVLRVETLDAYSSASDADYLDRFRNNEPKPDPAEKQAWLDRLAAADHAGRPWRRLRVVTRPVGEYVRYACEWGYVDNVAAGEDVRVLDEADHPEKVAGLVRLGDVLMLDGHPVWMGYNSAGKFVTAWRSEMPVHAELDASWRAGEPFGSWWARHVDLHRQLSAA